MSTRFDAARTYAYALCLLTIADDNATAAMVYASQGLTASAESAKSRAADAQCKSDALMDSLELYSDVQLSELLKEFPEVVKEVADKFGVACGA